MKIINKILLGLLILILLLTGLVIACFLNPNLASGIGSVLYHDNPDEDVVDEYEPDDELGYDMLGDSDIPDTFDNAATDSYDYEPKEQEDVEANGASELSDVEEDDINLYQDIPEYDITPSDSYPFRSMPYVAPDESEMDVPMELSRKSGYEFPRMSKKDIEDNEADEIEDTLGPGETGDGLDFDALYYPYYHMLDERGKQLYRQIYANANALNKRFSPVIECSANEVSKAMQAVFCDHPELFFINTAYNLKCRRGGKVSEIDLSFNQTAGNIAAAREAFDTATDAIVNNASQLGSDFEKEKYVHDILADKIDYSLSAPMNQSAYSALVNDTTVCAGYARAMQHIMTKLSIPCYYCTGFAGENHAWNIIKLDNDFYNLDVTWDDADPTNYDYFNKTDADYARNHIRKNLSVNLPACNGTGYQVEGEELPADTNDNGDEFGERIIILELN